MKRIVCFALIFCMVLPLLSANTAFAASDSYFDNLTWDGQPATLREIYQNLLALGSAPSMIDGEGNYRVRHYSAATTLWENGLMLGSNNTFNLDRPLTRTEGVIMVLRLLGKEQEAIEQNLACPFTDVPAWAQAQIAYAAANGITSGYSTDIFGANDYMTANQYLTFVLRALGYTDRGENPDFIWDKAADFALEIDLIDQPLRNMYMRSNLFLRDDVARVSWNAVFWVQTKDGNRLSSSITAQRPEGMPPYATAEMRNIDAAAKAESPELSIARASGTGEGLAARMFFAYNYTSGILTSISANYRLTVNNNYTGPVEVTVQAGDVTFTHTVDVDGRGVYPLNYTFACSTTPGYRVTHQIKITAGSAAFNDTLTADGATITAVGLR